MIRLYATILPFPVILRRRIKPEARHAPERGRDGGATPKQTGVLLAFLVTFAVVGVIRLRRGKSTADLSQEN